MKARVLIADDDAKTRFIQKPITFSELDRLIKELCSAGEARP